MLKSVFTAVLGTGALAIAWLILALTQLLAFLAGLQTLFNIGPVVAVLLYLLVLLLTGPIGGLLMSVVGFYGAVYGWGWAWWQALLLIFPFFVVSLALLASAGLGGALLLTRLFKRR